MPGDLSVAPSCHGPGTAGPPPDSVCPHLPAHLLRPGPAASKKHPADPRPPFSRHLRAIQRTPPYLHRPLDWARGTQTHRRSGGGTGHTTKTPGRRDLTRGNRHTGRRLCHLSAGRREAKPHGDPASHPPGRLDTTRDEDTREPGASPMVEKRCEPPEGPTGDDWVNGMCPSAGRSSAVKRNEVPTPAATWAHPQSTGLQEGSRTKRQHARWFRYTDGPEQTDSWGQGQGQGPRSGDGYGERGLFPK